jgi:hypothetical protein
MSNWSFLPKDWSIWCSKSYRLYNKKSLFWRKLNVRLWCQLLNLKTLWIIKIIIRCNFKVLKVKFQHLITVWYTIGQRTILNKNKGPKMMILRLFWMTQTYWMTSWALLPQIVIRQCLTMCSINKLILALPLRKSLISTWILTRWVQMRDWYPVIKLLVLKIWSNKTRCWALKWYNKIVSLIWGKLSLTTSSSLKLIRALQKRSCLKHSNDHLRYLNRNQILMRNTSINN